MPTTPTNPTLDDGLTQAAKTAPAAANSEQHSFSEAAELARQSINETAVRAQRAVQDTLETLRAQSRTYVDNAGQQFDIAQRYVTERVKERPMTATLAGVGVGLLLGLLLAGRNHNSR